MPALYGVAAHLSMRESAISEADVWLPGLDSNQGQGIQSPLCYRCTTGHCGA